MFVVNAAVVGEVGGLRVQDTRGGTYDPQLGAA